jgi:hypothetical protein
VSLARTNARFEGNSGSRALGQAPGPNSRRRLQKARSSVRQSDRKAFKSSGGSERSGRVRLRNPPRLANRTRQCPRDRQPSASLWRSAWWRRTSRSTNRLAGVVIMDSSTIVHARLRAAVGKIDGGAEFAEGHELDPATAALVPAKAIGRMLDPVEAGELIRAIERGMRKRPAAPSVKRRPARRKRGPIEPRDIVSLMSALPVRSYRGR